jgi:hypothetical protein
MSFMGMFLQHYISFLSVKNRQKKAFKYYKYSKSWPFKMVFLSVGHGNLRRAQ